MEDRTTVNSILSSFWFHLSDSPFVWVCRMFTALHKPQSEYDAPAPFAMPSYASVMSQFNQVSFS